MELDLSSFIHKHQLPEQYQNSAQKWFFGLAKQLKSKQASQQAPLVIGINGTQGSGKSTLADLLVFIFQNHFKQNAISLSVDDFYLTRAERSQLADTVHPLLMTRGVPGTHDVDMAIKVISSLKNNTLPVTVPRFNKAIDDRDETNETINQAVDIIILEGWCVGSEAQEPTALSQPVNELEKTDDPDSTWRQYVNTQLNSTYPALFELIDAQVMLKAPSFDTVFNWRLEQEDKLRQKVQHDHSAQQHVMSEQQIARFIQFYQRITEHTLATMPATADYVFELNTERQIIQQQGKLANTSKQWLIFTDMDGTLLDHHTYSFEPASATLGQLADKKVPVIPVSSKTQAELESLRDDLDLAHPFIIENGAAALIPVGYFKQQPTGTTQQNGYWVKAFVPPRQTWLDLIKTLKPDYQNQFIGFSEMGIDGIIEATGLSSEAAALARQRQYGEPIKWLGDAETKQHFINAIKQQGGFVLEGGRFLHISGNCDKGQALQWLSELYQQQDTDMTISSIALGDSQNDVAMLEAANEAVLIRSPSHEPPALQRQSGIHIPDEQGPTAWSKAVQSIINL